MKAFVRPLICDVNVGMSRHVVAPLLCYFYYYYFFEFSIIYCLVSRCRECVDRMFRIRRVLNVKPLSVCKKFFPTSSGFAFFTLNASIQAVFSSADDAAKMYVLRKYNIIGDYSFSHVTYLLLFHSFVVTMENWYGFFVTPFIE